MILFFQGRLDIAGFVNCVCQCSALGTVTAANIPKIFFKKACSCGPPVGLEVNLVWYWASPTFWKGVKKFGSSLMIGVDRICLMKTIPRLWNTRLRVPVQF